MISGMLDSQGVIQKRIITNWNPVDFSPSVTPRMKSTYSGSIVSWNKDTRSNLFNKVLFFRHVYERYSPFYTFVTGSEIFHEKAAFFSRVDFIPYNRVTIPPKNCEQCFRIVRISGSVNFPCELFSTWCSFWDGEQWVTVDTCFCRGWLIAFVREIYLVKFVQILVLGLLCQIYRRYITCIPNRLLALLRL